MEDCKKHTSICYPCPEVCGTDKPQDCPIVIRAKTKEQPQMIRPGTAIRVRDNEPESLFGPIYDCTIADHHPEIGITLKYRDKNIVCIDMEKQAPHIARKIMDYIVRHANCGSIINLGTIRQIQIDETAKILSYNPADIARYIQRLPGNPQCAFAENEKPRPQI